jgi:hypothetical protein
MPTAPFPPSSPLIELHTIAFKSKLGTLRICIDNANRLVYELVVLKPQPGSEGTVGTPITLTEQQVDLILRVVAYKT